MIQKQYKLPIQRIQSKARNDYAICKNCNKSINPDSDNKCLYVNKHTMLCNECDEK